MYVKLNNKYRIYLWASRQKYHFADALLFSINIQAIDFTLKYTHFLTSARVSELFTSEPAKSRGTRIAAKQARAHFDTSRSGAPCSDKLDAKLFRLGGAHVPLLSNRKGRAQA